MANLLKSALDKRLKVTRSAFERVRKNAGQETYRPLEIYKKLRPEDFTAIANRYGLDNTLRYIRAMEGRRMKGKK